MEALGNARFSQTFCGRDGEYLTPVMYAIALGYTGMMGVLVRYAANLRIKSNKGRTALMFAARFRRLEITRQLSNERLDPDAVDRSGFAAVDWVRAAARERLALQSTSREKLVVGDEDGEDEKLKWIVRQKDEKEGGPVLPIVAAITQRTKLGFTESNILHTLEVLSRRYGTTAATNSAKILRSMGFAVSNPTQIVESSRSAMDKFASFCLTIAQAPTEITRSFNVNENNASLLAALELARPSADAVKTLLDDSASKRRRDANCDDEGDDELDETLIPGAGQYRDAPIARSPVLPDAADFSTAAILGEKPPTGKLHARILDMRKTRAEQLKKDGEIVNDPIAFPKVVAQRSKGGAVTLLKALPKNFTISATSGRAMAVVPLDRTDLGKGRSPALVPRDSTMANRGMMAFAGVPLAVRERNAITVMVEEALAPVLQVVRMPTEFNFLKPENEVATEWVAPHGLSDRQATLFGKMRGALILYNKQQLERLGELAAPIVLMDMQSLEPDDIGEYSAPTDPCEHCATRRAVVRCVNCAAAHCERCTLWLHKQPDMRHHRCRPILPAGLHEGKLMTRQARRVAASKDMATKLQSFPQYVEKLRKVMRRVKQRIHAAREAVDAANVCDLTAAANMIREMDERQTAARTGGATDTRVAALLKPVLPAAPGTGAVGPVKSSRVAAYHKWIQSIPGSVDAPEIAPLIKPDTWKNSEDKYEPPPAVLGKLLTVCRRESSCADAKCLATNFPFPSTDESEYQQMDGNQPAALVRSRASWAPAAPTQH
jgi:hypothetical protein